MSHNDEHGQNLFHTIFSERTSASVDKAELLNRIIGFFRTDALSTSDASGHAAIYYALDSYKTDAAKGLKSIEILEKHRVKLDDHSIDIVKEYLSPPGDNNIAADLLKNDTSMILSFLVSQIRDYSKSEEKAFQSILDILMAQATEWEATR